MAVASAWRRPSPSSSRTDNRAMEFGRTFGPAGRNVALLIAAWFLGCYQPKVVPGHLKCGPPSKPCPDGFTCVDDLCQAKGDGGLVGGGAGGGAGMGGAGGAPSCDNPVGPLCASTDVSSGCDPVCQTGCACGQRCLVLEAGLGCSTASGAKALGRICQPGADECRPGLACLAESCGTNLGRCRRMCRDASVCTGGGSCTRPILLANLTPSGQNACDLGDEKCDPYATSGCPDPSLHCYVTGPSHTSCDCPSTPGSEGTEGQVCSAYNDCAVGLACIQAGGSSRCMRLCQSAADCPTCAAFGSVKYCALAPAN